MQNYIDDKGLLVHRDQGYNIDETGLYLKLLLKKTIATAQEITVSGFSGFKTNKERITAAVFSNTTGTHKVSFFCQCKYDIYSWVQKLTCMDGFLFKKFVSQGKKKNTYPD